MVEMVVGSGEREEERKERERKDITRRMAT